MKLMLLVDHWLKSKDKRRHGSLRLQNLNSNDEDIHPFVIIVIKLWTYYSSTVSWTALITSLNKTLTTIHQLQTVNYILPNS